MSRSARKTKGTHLRLVSDPMPAQSPLAESATRTPETYLIGSAFVVSFSGIAYELLLATYATYLWGGSVYQYSLVFSSMMLAMGLGSWVADRSQKDPSVSFLAIECVLSLLGIICLPILYTAYYKGWAPLLFTFGFSLGFGFLVGLEIPLLNRWLGRERKVAELLAVDFAGGFLGGVLFPLFLVPYLGLFRVAALVAVLNSLVALWGTRHLANKLPLQGVGTLVTVLGVALLIKAEALQSWLQRTYFGF